MSFRTTKIQRSGNRFLIYGILTIKGVSKKAVFTGKASQQIKDPWGNHRIGISLRASIDRRSYGITWFKLMDKGGLVVGNEVDIELNLEGIRVKGKKDTPLKS